MPANQFHQSIAEVYEFITGLIDENQTGIRLSNAQMTIMTDETKYKEYIRLFLFDSPKKLIRLFKLNMVENGECMDPTKICPHSLGIDLSSKTSPTLRLHLKTATTIQELINEKFCDVKWEEASLQCNYPMCGQNMMVKKHVEVRPYLIIENLEHPCDRGSNGETEKNGRIKMGSVTYELIGVVFIRDGNICTLRDKDGGTMPNINKWYYGIYKTFDVKYN